MNLSQTKECGSMTNESNKKRKYEAPRIEISFLNQEYGFAAGSVRRDNVEPIIAEWDEIETESIWNF